MSLPLRVMIVDDEPLARARLKKLLLDVKDFEVVSEADNGIQALQLVDVKQPDIILLDIAMPGKDGLSVAQTLAEQEHPPAIIFTTAYDEYAIRAFKVEAVAYLVKPVKKESLVDALKRCSKVNAAQIHRLHNEHNVKKRSHLSVNQRGNIVLVPINEILYFRAEQKYVTIKLIDNEYLTEETLKQLEKEFEDSFLRIHRNTLVAKKLLNGMSKDDAGHFFISLKGVDETMSVSRRHVARVRKVIKGL